jgi:hypothetical protein
MLIRYHFGEIKFGMLISGSIVTIEAPNFLIEIFFFNLVISKINISVFTYVSGVGLVIF